jgi:diaminobutyrate acetyltransferase
MTKGIQNSAILLRSPTADDAASLHRLVAECPPLDPNSLYCNLLHCTHFSATSVAAVKTDDHGQEVGLVGFISAYIPPGQPDTLFVWQVAVANDVRGLGLARKMLDHIIERPECRGVRFIDTTITPGNRASWALFESWARHHDAPTSHRLHFERERHFEGQHDDEHLMRIGPFEIAAESAT